MTVPTEEEQVVIDVLVKHLDVAPLVARALANLILVKLGEI